MQTNRAKFAQLREIFSYAKCERAGREVETIDLVQSTKVISSLVRDLIWKIQEL